MFWETFLRLCSKAGKTPNAVAKELSISSGSVTFWKKGKEPQDGNLLKIAEYFGVPVQYLKTGDDSLLQAGDADPLDGLRFALFGEPAKDVTEAQLDDVKRYAAYIRERDKEKK